MLTDVPAIVSVYHVSGVQASSVQEAPTHYAGTPGYTSDIVAPVTTGTEVIGFSVDGVPLPSTTTVTFIDPPKLTVTFAHPTVRQGDVQTATVRGLIPDDWMYLGTDTLADDVYTADSHGTVTVSWRIGARSLLGRQTFSVNAMASGEVETTFNVVAAASTSAAELPDTGAGVSPIVPATGTLLIALGVLLILRVRRRAAS